MSRIYLDNNATTPVLPRVAEAMARSYASGPGNAASQHAAGRRARQALDTARESLASLLGAECGSSRSDQVIFTSGGTEGNNLAILGLAGGTPAHAILSAIEHPSVAGAASHLRCLGWDVETLPVSAQGVVDVDRLQDTIRADTRLASIVLGNNETGVLQPVARAARYCADRGVPLHTDAVQVAGKLPVDFRALHVAAMTVSAHKFHGPQGVGALILRHDVALEPQLHGGFQQGGLRPGTEPVALAVGMQAALECWHADRNAIADRLTDLRDVFESALRGGWPELVVNGGGAPRLPHTSNVAFPGLDRQALVMALDLAGVACSTGSACASGSPEPSPTLVAMGCPKTVLGGALRFSVGQQTTAEEVVEAARRILNVCNDLRAGKSPRKKAFGGRRLGSILLE
ncbi:MAG: cysteine desulfurase [Planctomycetia bacterium]|nr:cysteine desulfurase [Planctomycetia bacterium]